MCGIAGVFNYPASAEERLDVVRGMCEALQHRGPDDSGSMVDANIAIGIRRLSIVDLIRGHQPMTTADGALHIVFNGEIFNFRELRETLIQHGERFSTDADTEVLLKQFARFGVDGLHALNGMFAMAIWDARSKTLTLARDRMGVKPLYYYWSGGIFAFASEIKAVLEPSEVIAEVNPSAIWHYLTFRYVPAPETVWKEVWKLPPAHVLTISEANPQPQVRRWWDIPAADTGDDERSESTLVQQFGNLFTDAVRLRMLADVPVGITLSGGLDSSAVAAVAARYHPKLQTFSVGYAGSSAVDERPFARTVAAHLGSEHSEITVSQREFVDFLPAFVRYTDEPIADLASIPLYYVCHLARASVKVVLSGEGADEILAGYDFARWWSQRVAAVGPSGGDVRADAEPAHMTNYMTSAEKQALFLQPIGAPDSVAVLRADLARGGHRHPLDQMLYLYCQNWLVEDLLMKADRMSMANSIELRTPFLDYRLVEWAARAPLSAKLDMTQAAHQQTKAVLRKFARTLLPEEIVSRPKQGFPVPAYEWLSGSLGSFVTDLLLDPLACVRSWFDAAGIEQFVRHGLAADAPMHARHRLWHLVILEYWLQVWTRR
jgi:asparagine synthase (glutamine-hydrolysing)